MLSCKILIMFQIAVELLGCLVSAFLNEVRLCLPEVSVILSVSCRDVPRNACDTREAVPYTLNLLI